MHGGAARWVPGLLIVAASAVALLAVGSAPAHASMERALAPVQCSSGLALALSQPSGPAPLLVTFSLTVLWGTPTTSQWNFGDGTPMLNGSSAYYLHPSHTYSTLGTFEATVFVTDGQRTGACSVGIATVAPELRASALPSHLSGTVPYTAHLSASVAGGSGTFSQVGWDLGDGHSELGANVSYTYTVPGAYTATFTVVDSAGNQAEAKVVVDVAPITSPATSGAIDVGTWTGVGAVVATLAIFAGAGLYVRSHSPAFGDDGSDEEDATGLVEAEPPADAEEDPDRVPERPGMLSVASKFPPATYRGVFLDLSDREYDVLVDEPGADRAIVPFPTGPASIVPPFGRPSGPPLSQRVVHHLVALPKLGPEDTATAAFTQAGMMAALEVPQSRLSNVLRRLTYSGILETRVEHVQGVARRLNVYRLTPKGEQLAARLRKRASSDVGAGTAS
jgi:DNA-binding MarR family transcriptional regulator